MTRFAQTERGARHIVDIRDQLVAVIGAGGCRLQLRLRSGVTVVGRLTCNRQGGNLPHCFSSLSIVGDTGQAAEFDFLDVRTLDRA